MALTNVSDRDIQRRLAQAVKGRPVVKGVTLDSVQTRRMDDGFSLTRKPDGWTLAFSIADVAAIVEKGDVLDHAARKATTKNKRHIFPDNLSVQASSLAKKQLRPAITFTMNFSEDFELLDYDIKRTAFKSMAKYGIETLENEAPPQELANWREFANGIADRRKAQLQGALTRNFNRCAGVWGTRYKYESTCTKAEGCVDIIAEMTILTSRVAADYMRKNNLPAYYRISGDMEPEVLEGEDVTDEMKEWMEGILDELTQSVDVAHMLSVDVTTPIRRYDNLVMQRILAAHLDGAPSPYTLEELRELKPLCRWVQKDPRSVKLDFNDIVRDGAPMEENDEMNEAAQGNDKQKLCDLVEKAGLSLRSISGRVHMLGFSFCVEGLSLENEKGECLLKAAAASDQSGKAKNGAAAGILAQMKQEMPDIYQRHI